MKTRIFTIIRPGRRCCGLRLRNTRGRGFSLIELLLVIVLISLMAGIAGGLYTGTYQHMLVKRAARDLLVTAKYARVFAIENRRRCTLRIEPKNNTFMLTTIISEGENEDNEESQISNIYTKPTELPEAVEFETVRKLLVSEFPDTEQDDGCIVFRANGTAESALIQVGDGKNHYTVVVTGSTGRARVERGSAEQIEPDTIDLDAI